MASGYFTEQMTCRGKMSQEQGNRTVQRQQYRRRVVTARICTVNFQRKPGCEATWQLKALRNQIELAEPQQTEVCGGAWDRGGWVRRGPGSAFCWPGHVWNGCGETGPHFGPMPSILQRESQCPGRYTDFPIDLCAIIQAAFSSGLFILALL